MLGRARALIESIGILAYQISILPITLAGDEGNLKQFGSRAAAPPAPWPAAPVPTLLSAAAERPLRLAPKPPSPPPAPVRSGSGDPVAERLRPLACCFASHALGERAVRFVGGLIASHVITAGPTLWFVAALNSLCSTGVSPACGLYPESTQRLP